MPEVVTTTKCRANPRLAALAGEGVKAGLLGVAVNGMLMLVKLVTGVVGNSYALIADGIESGTDVLSTVIAWAGFRYSLKPPDQEHPFGHGKAESLASAFSGLALLGAAGVIAVQSVREIANPQGVPAWYTLPVLAVVVLAKEWLFRHFSALARAWGSRAAEGDAWHQRSDSITSAAAFIGISIALWGGPAYASADGWAALVACVVIAWSGARLLRRAFHDVMDGAVDPAMLRDIEAAAGSVGGVIAIETCRVRRSGVGFYLELHAVVSGSLSVREGHAIAHQIKNRLAARYPHILDTVVHIEPD